MDAAHKPADCAAVRAATEEESKRVISQTKEAAMGEEKPSLPLAMSDVELSERDIEVILDAAKTTPSVVSRLRRAPYIAPERVAVAN